MKSVVAFIALLACVYAQTQVLPSGFLADTPEVASARAAHLAEIARATYASGASSAEYYDNDYNNGYYRSAAANPIAYSYNSIAHLLRHRAYSHYNYAQAAAPVTVLPSGFLADTPEVAQAKIDHAAEFARAAAAAGSSPSYAGDSNPYYSDYYTWNGYSWVANQ